jgi:hypothetical protein
MKRPYKSVALCTVNGVLSVGFTLDANEPGAAKSLISIDNIAVYTSTADHTAAAAKFTGGVLNNIGALGTLRWAMNNATLTSKGAVSGSIGQYITLDASQETHLTISLTVAVAKPTSLSIFRSQPSRVLARMTTCGCTT